MAKKSYLSWTFLQSSYWSAILEILLCWVLLLTGLWFFRKEHSTSIAFAFTVILTFCFLHQYSAALLAGCFYTLFICLLGSFICRVLHKPRLEIISDKMQYTAFLPTTTDVWPQHRAYGNATTVTADAYFEYLQFADMKYLLLDADFMSDDSWTAEIMRGLAETGRVTTSLLNEHWALVKISPSSGSPDSALLDWFGTVSSIPESSQKLQ